MGQERNGGPQSPFIHRPRAGSWQARARCTARGWRAAVSQHQTSNQAWTRVLRRQPPSQRAGIPSCVCSALLTSGQGEKTADRNVGDKKPENQRRPCVQRQPAPPPPSALASPSSQTPGAARCCRCIGLFSIFAHSASASFLLHIASWLSARFLCQRPLLNTSRPMSAAGEGRGCLPIRESCLFLSKRHGYAPFVSDSRFSFPCADRHSCAGCRANGQVPGHARAWLADIDSRFGQNKVCTVAQRYQLSCGMSGSRCTEIAMEIPSQSAITADNVVLDLDGILYIRVFDPYKAR